MSEDEVLGLTEEPSRSRSARCRERPTTAQASGTWSTPTPATENKVKSNLESRIASKNMGERSSEVVIPVEDVIESRTAKKQVVSKKVFPGLPPGSHGS